MRICFFANGPKSGLAPNGGSKTIVESANTLINLGHEVTICAKYNQYSWGALPPIVKYVPSGTDVLISVSCKDVKNCLKHPVGKKFWWMRGLEFWAMPKEKILQRARSINVIANAGHLVSWLAKYQILAQLSYSGLDIEKWKDLGTRKKKVRIGCLYHSRHLTKNWKDFEKLSVILGFRDYEYAGFGVGGPRDLSWLA